ncbi:MAG TPA: hypothetical protein VFO41_12140 [Alphaproteobacteria bacterium]|nr:hypothetical protein [Alphaproteobacteria bacterium]
MRRRIDAAFGAVEQVRSQSGEDGMTTVTLKLRDDDREREAAEFLRRQREIVDAVQESFGEHA